jgi:hypothetical protein
MLRHACLSVIRMEQISSYCTDFHTIWYFSKICRKNSSLIQLTGTLHEKPSVHMWYLTELFLEWEMFQTKFVDKINTFYVQQLFPQSRSVYEIMWKNYGRARRATDDKITRRMRFACRKTKARIQTHLKTCNIYCFSTATMVARTRLDVTFYYSACLF